MNTIAWLNALPPAQAEAELLDCCGARAWARKMVASRPFASRDAVFQHADEVWLALSPNDWLEAFRAHPRIGAELAVGHAEGPRAHREKDATSDTRSTRWSAPEQAEARAMSSSVRDELARSNQRYEERFGHVFLICATGRTAEEMLGALHSRLHNDPATELRIAAEEQRRITHLRLERLLCR